MDNKNKSQVGNFKISHSELPNVISSNLKLTKAHT